MRTSSGIRILRVSGNFQLQEVSDPGTSLNIFPLHAGTEITGLAHQLGYEREVIRIWFCNKRQALKNTVRMMSKGMV